ncbi:hypothetical protein ACM66B_001095 [Microbotryomycetes sp. NB124-2]
MTNLSTAYYDSPLTTNQMSSTALSYEKTGLFHRVPVGFGPTLSPRQDPQGKRYDWSQSKATTIGVTFKSEHDNLDEILPEGYSVDRSKPAVIMFEASFERDT